MLTSLARLKSTLGVSVTDASADVALGQALAAADAAVKAFTKRRLERAVLTEYYSGSGTPDIALRQRPVTTYPLSGTLSSGSAAVTGISSTAALLAGMPAVHASIPAGAVISAVNSSTQVTLSANATASGSASIVFGLQVWLDAQGYYGDGAGAFGADEALTLGSDYALLRDAPDGSSLSGVLKRLGGGPVGSVLEFPWTWRRGSLTARAGPAWPVGSGNLKVVYTGGYRDVPEDLEQAVCQLAVWLWKYAPQGGLMTTSESYENYTYSLGILRNEPDLGSARQILTRYREVSV